MGWFNHQLVLLRHEIILMVFSMCVVFFVNRFSFSDGSVGSLGTHANLPTPPSQVGFYDQWRLGDFQCRGGESHTHKHTKKLQGFGGGFQVGGDLPCKGLRVRCYQALLFCENDNAFNWCTGFLKFKVTLLCTDQVGFNEKNIYTSNLLPARKACCYLYKQDIFPLSKLTSQWSIEQRCISCWSFPIYLG